MGQRERAKSLKAQFSPQESEEDKGKPSEKDKERKARRKKSDMEDTAAEEKRKKKSDEAILAEKRSSKGSKRSPRDEGSDLDKSPRDREQVRKLKSVQGTLFSPPNQLKDNKERVRKLQSTQGFRSPSSGYHDKDDEHKFPQGNSSAFGQSIPA